MHRIASVVLAAASAFLTLTSSAYGQRIELALVSLTSPVSAGAEATITVHSAPGARCLIAVRDKSGPSRAAGLVPKTANSRGQVSWTWRVGTRTTPGRWPIFVTCSAGEQQGTLETVICSAIVRPRPGSPRRAFSAASRRGEERNSGEPSAKVSFPGPRCPGLTPRVLGN